MMMPRLALIHATPVAIDPIGQAFERAWPEAETINILDDSLSRDRARSDTLTPELSVRIMDLAVYAKRSGADAILFTCSAFGAAIEAVQQDFDIPVLKPNEAMFEAALAEGRRSVLIATFGPSIAGMEAEFRADAAARGSDAEITSVLVEAGMAALREGDVARHNALVSEAAQSVANADVIMLAQFSTARAAQEARQRSTIPVLTSPYAAVSKLKLILCGS